MGKPKEEDEKTYMQTCQNRLKDELDILIYYGIGKGIIKPPRGHSTGNHILTFYVINRPEKCFAACIVYCCEQYCSALLHLMEGNNAEQ